MIKNIFDCRIFLFILILCNVFCSYNGDSILNYKGGVVVEVKDLTLSNNMRFIVFVRLKEDNKWVIKRVECKDGDLFQVGDTTWEDVIFYSIRDVFCLVNDRYPGDAYIIKVLKRIKEFTLDYFNNSEFFKQHYPELYE